MTNREISGVFSMLSKLMDLHNENSFKSKSYANAAFQIDRLPLQLTGLSPAEIASQKGVGESTAKKIIELIESGELKQLNDLVDKTPDGILELMKIKGIGPKKIASIWHELGIESPGELLYACEENRLVHYKGFGEKSQQGIQEALEFYFNNLDRFLYAVIAELALSLQNELRLLFSDERIQLSGAFLRQCEIIDELEFVIPFSKETVQENMQTRHDFDLVDEDEHILIYKFNEACKIKMYTCEADTFNKILFLTSGSELFIEAFKNKFPDADLYVGDEKIFSDLGMQYIPPCLREEAGIIEKALLNAIPGLIQTSDIKGVIHNHSTWSDGKCSIEEMAQACIDKGYEYMVMSDHSVTSYYVGGLTVEQIKKQQEEIIRLNEKLKPFKIFTSIECDILGDGSLDYADDVLAGFDLVLVSIHQNLKMTEEKAMMRLMKAIEHPASRILCHPTGRLLLSRKGYPVDHEKIIDACKKHGVVIEINANPRRLDMDWRWLRYAMEQQVLISINPDAHSIQGINDIRYGVLAAQKGMVRAADNVSSFSLVQFEEFLKSKK